MNNECRVKKQTSPRVLPWGWRTGHTLTTRWGEVRPRRGALGLAPRRRDQLPRWLWSPALAAFSAARGQTVERGLAFWWMGGLGTHAWGGQSASTVRGRSAPPCALALSPHLCLDSSRFWVTQPGRPLCRSGTRNHAEAARQPCGWRGRMASRGPARWTGTAWARLCEALLRQRGSPFQVTVFLSLR